MAALPGLKDLLPDHLFYNSSASQLPPPPSSILQHASSSQSEPPRYKEVSFRSHRPPTPSHSSFSRVYESYPSAPAFDANRESVSATTPLDDLHGSNFHHEDPSRSWQSQHGFSIDIEDARAHEKQTADGDNHHKKHTCPTCGKRFNRPSSLRIHVNTHTGAKPYVCPFPGCSRLFNVSSNMRRHYRNHASRAPMPLPVPSGSVHDPYTQAAWIQMTDSDGFGSTMRGAVAAARAAQRMPSDVPFAPLGRLDADEVARCGLLTTQDASSSKTQLQFEYPYPSTSSTSLLTHPPRLASTQNAYPYASTDQQEYDTYSYAARERFNIEHVESIHAYDSRQPDSSYSHTRPNQHLISAATLDGYATTPTSITPGTGHAHSRHYDIPPTPPYTSEAALSPCAHASAPVAPGEPYPTQSSVHVQRYNDGKCGHGLEGSACFACWRPGAPRDDSPLRREGSRYDSEQPQYEDSYVHRTSVSSTRDEQNQNLSTKRDTMMDVRQQPSPDTPSMHVPPLHAEHQNMQPSISEHEAERKGEEGSENKCSTGKTHSDSRARLSITAIVNPTDKAPEEPSRQCRSQSGCPADVVADACPSSLPLKSQSSVDTLGTGEGNAVIGLETAIRETNGTTVLDSETTETKTSTNDSAVGTTPGAAPPPPYPLLKRPMSFAIEDDRVEDEPLSSGRRAGRRRVKKRQA